MSDTSIEATPISEVKGPPPEVMAELEREQINLDKATQQAQLNYLSSRIQELVTENVELKAEIETLKKRKGSR